MAQRGEKTGDRAQPTKAPSSAPITPSAGWAGKVGQFFTDVRSEARKVTWPQRKEAVAGTIGVVVICAVITLVLGLFDFALAEAVKRVLP